MVDRMLDELNGLGGSRYIPKIHAQHEMDYQARRGLANRERDSPMTRLTEVRRRKLMSHGEAINEEVRGSGTAGFSGPGDEQGW